MQLVGGRRVGAGARHDERHADLAHALVGHADDRDLRDARGARSIMFSISAGYALKPPTMNMSLMRSVMRRLPRVVHHADVAGVQPAVGVDRLGGRLRVVGCSRCITL